MAVLLVLIFANTVDLERQSQAVAVAS